MAKYNLYIKQHKRKAFYKGPVSKAEALRFLENNKYGIIEDVEDIRYGDFFRFDNGTTESGEISESTDRQISAIDTDNAESSTERDN